MTHSELEKAIPSVIYENQTLNALYIPMASDYCFMKILSKVSFPPSDFRHDLTPSAVGLYVPVTVGGVLIAASPPAFLS